MSGSSVLASYINSISVFWFSSGVRAEHHQWVKTRPIVKKNQPQFPAAFKPVVGVTAPPDVSQLPVQHLYVRNLIIINYWKLWRAIRDYIFGYQTSRCHMNFVINILFVRCMSSLKQNLSKNITAYWFNVWSPPASTTRGRQIQNLIA